MKLISTSHIFLEELQKIMCGFDEYQILVGLAAEPGKYRFATHGPSGLDTSFDKIGSELGTTFSASQFLDTKIEKASSLAY